MAKPKTIGYVELEWTCPTCATRNPGTRKVCASCGAPQPDDAQFQAPEQAQVIQAGDAAAQAIAQSVAAGPDVHCPFCGARNAATAKECVQCQAPLQGAQLREQGANLGALRSGPQPDQTCSVCGSKNPGAAQACARCGAPLRRRTPEQASIPAPAGRGGGVALYWLIGGAVLLIAVVGIFVWLGMRTETQDAVAQEARWERSVTVLGFVPVEERAWEDELPSGADVTGCREVLRSTSDEPRPGSVEVCGEPYTVDTGTGFGEVRQDCEYQIYDRMCSYTTLQWVPVDTVRRAGVGFAPEWPAVGEAPDRRVGDRSERYQCVLEAAGERYTLDLGYDRWPLCTPGSHWKVEINGLGSLVDAQLTR